MNKNAARPSIEARLLVREVRALLRTNHASLSLRVQTLERELEVARLQGFGGMPVSARRPPSRASRRRGAGVTINEAVHD
jgi:hypothetical protein